MKPVPARAARTGSNPTMGPWTTCPPTMTYLVDFVDLIDELMTEQTIALLGSDERRDW